MALSNVTHGQESWFELTLELKCLRSIIQYQVDAFTKKDAQGDPVRFSGNPAAVILQSLKEEIMQQIAMENNLAETAFISPIFGDNCYEQHTIHKDNATNNEAHFNIRWFTPCCEIELCGHATLAASHVLFVEENMVNTSTIIVFHTKFHQVLRVRYVSAGEYELNFPSIIPVPLIPDNSIIQTICNALKLDSKDEIIYLGSSSTKYFMEVTNTAFDRVTYTTNEVNTDLLSALDTRGVVVTCMGCKHADYSSMNAELNCKDYDFISRFFAPRYE